MTSKGKQGRPEGTLATVPRGKGAKLREWREKAGLRQEDVGRKIGVTGPIVSQIENGKQTQINRASYAKWLSLASGRALAEEGEREALIELVLGAPIEVVPGIRKLADVYLGEHSAPKETPDDSARLGGNRARTPRGEK